MRAAPDEGFVRAETLLLEHRRLVVQTRALLARTATPAERLAMADELIALIDGLDMEKRALAARIRRGRVANAAVSAYGRAMAARREGAGWVGTRETGTPAKNPRQLSPEPPWNQTSNTRSQIHGA